MKYFAYQSIAREAKIPDQKLQKTRKSYPQEFPSDPMMAELHALRDCLAMRDGHIQLDDALKLQAESQVWRRPTVICACSIR